MCVCVYSLSLSLSQRDSAQKKKKSKFFFEGWRLHDFFFKILSCAEILSVCVCVISVFFFVATFVLLLQSIWSEFEWSYSSFSCSRCIITT